MTVAAQNEALSEDTGVSHPPNHEARWLIGLVAVAVILRLLVLVLRPLDLRTDPDAYIALAQTIVDTGGLHSPDSTTPTAFRPPLYPFLLAALMWAGLKSTVSIALTAVCAGAMVTIATWWTARLLGLRGFWCRAATLLVVADPLLLRYTPSPMTETLAAALLAIAMLQLLKAVQAATSPASPRRIVVSSVTAGLTFALAGYCRPICFLTCGVATACVVLRLRTHLCRALILPPLVCGLLLLPWMIRNAVHFHAFVPLTTHGGYTLLLGNNEVFYRDVVDVPGQPVWLDTSFANWEMRLKLEMSEAGIVSEIDRDQWMYERAKSNITRDRGLFLRACLLRWKWFWALQPRVAGRFVSQGVIFAVGVWYFLQWVGLVASLHVAVRKPEILILWSAVISFMAVHTFYWTNTRMRAPLTGVTVVLVVTGWHHLVQYWKTVRRPPA